MQEKAEKL